MTFLIEVIKGNVNANNLLMFCSGDAICAHLVS